MCTHKHPIYRYKRGVPENSLWFHSHFLCSHIQFILATQIAECEWTHTQREHIRMLHAYQTCWQGILKHKWGGYTWLDQVPRDHLQEQRQEQREKKIKSDFQSWQSHCISFWHGYAAHFTTHFKDEGSLLLLANFKGLVPFRAHSWVFPFREANSKSSI